MSNDLHTVRWGVMGTARIATRVTNAIHAVEGAEATAIASRSAERAAAWAAEHNVQRSYGEYQALLDDPELDAIYIPLPPSMHHEWTIRAAEAGKHVLCEKPIAVTTAEAEEMAAACREHNVQFMDGVMWVHHPRAAAMLNAIRDESFGKLRRITSGFSFQMETWLQNSVPFAKQIQTEASCDNTPITTLDDAKPNELRLQRELGGGCLGDLGWYNVRATLWAFGGLPQRVFGTARYRYHVDLNFSGLMWYDNDRIASFDCGFDQTWRKWFEVIGTGGSLVCDDFVAPWDPEHPRFWIHDTSGKPCEHSAEPQIQEQCMIEDFCEIVRSGNLDDRWPNDAIANQRVIEALDKSARTEQVVEIV